MVESTQKAVLIKVEVGQPLTSRLVPAIKQKLEDQKQKQCSMDAILRKMSQAAEKRNEHLRKTKASARKSIDRVKANRQRKSSVDKMFEKQIAINQMQKMTEAGEKRQSKIEDVQSKAKDHNSKVAVTVSTQQQAMKQGSTSARNLL